MKISDDVRRCYQVHKETVNPEHPFSKFSVGNLPHCTIVRKVRLREEVKAFLHSITWRRQNGAGRTIRLVSRSARTDHTPIFPAIVKQSYNSTNISTALSGTRSTP